MANVEPELVELAEELRDLRGADDNIDWTNARAIWVRPGNKKRQPKAIRSQSDYFGGPYLSVACTQTELPASQQKKLVESWRETLPNLTEVRWLWFQSKVSQELFEAACQMPNLESLYISWSGIKDVSPLGKLQRLRNLYIGSFVQADNFEVLAGLPNLKWVQLNNLRSIKSLEPIAALSGLHGLGITGNESKRLVLPTFSPLAALENLEWLHLGAVYPEDASLRAFDNLKKLKWLGVGNYFPTEEFARLSYHLDSSVCVWLKPYARSHSSVFPCRKCGKNNKVKCSGKGGRLLCPTCDPLPLARHVLRFRRALEGYADAR